MKLKLDDKGNAVLQDGKPVYIHDDGKEVAFDAPSTLATISRLNGEAKGHREAKEAAETKLKAFDGIEDPAGAIKALGIVKSLDDKTLVAAGKVDEIRAAAIKATEEKFAAAATAAETARKTVEGERDKLRADLHGEMIGGSFARSKFIADKLAIPGEFIRAQFGGNFDIKDGKIVAKDAAGNPIYSRTKPGELADFEESLETLVDAHPQKAHILKGSGANGGGGSGSGKGPAGGKTMTRTQFEALSPMERPAKIKEGFTVTD